MKALVKNLGDQLNVPVEELENLDLAKFVDDAIKVEAGELTTLRVSFVAINLYRNEPGTTATYAFFVKIAFCQIFKKMNF